MKQIPRELIPSDSQFLQINLSYVDSDYVNDNERRKELGDYIQRFFSSLLSAGMGIDDGDMYTLEVPKNVSGSCRWEKINIKVTSAPKVVFHINGKVTQCNLDVEYWNG